MSTLLSTLRPNGKPPTVPTIKIIVICWIGAFLAIATAALAALETHEMLVLGSFGATCVLLFGFPDSPFSQPRHVIGGHLITSATGLVFLMLFGSTWWSMGLATATAISLMQVTRTVHPPAGSNPVIVMLSQPSWWFLLFPTLIGILIIQAVGLVWHKLNRRTYPTYWV